MTSPVAPRRPRSRGLWPDRGWPVFAGAVAAVGVFAASTRFGIVPLLAVYTLLSLFSVVVVWGISLEIGVDRSSVVRWSLYGSLAVLALVGLCRLHPTYGLLLGLAVGLTSPAAHGLLARARSRPAESRTDEPAPGVLVDSATLDRRFDEIVSPLRTSGDFPEW